MKSGQLSFHNLHDAVSTGPVLAGTSQPTACCAAMVRRELSTSNWKDFWGSSKESLFLV